MQQLADQIATHQCPKHKLPYCFVYKGVIKDNESRLMCEDCMNPQNSNQLIQIRKTFRFLSEQQESMNNKVHQIQVSIWQRFKQVQVQITELINGLEFQIEQLFNYIKENQVINRLNNEFLNKLTTQQSIESFGQYLSSVIDQDMKGQYELKQVQLDNQCFLQCEEILKQQQQIFEEINRICKSQDQQIQQITKSEEQIRNMQKKNENYSYETRQTIQLQDVIASLCFNHNETQIIAACGNEILIFELTQQGEWVQGEFSQSTGHNYDAWKVQCNYNSTLIASCGEDNQIFIWNQQRDGKWCIQHKLSSHKDTVSSICFNHNSTLLVSGSDDNTIIIHELKYGKWGIYQVIELTYNVYDVCFNHNTTLLASSGDILNIWYLNNKGKWIVQQQLKGHTKHVNGILFNSDSTQLISCSDDNTIIIWSVDKDRIWKSTHTLSGHQNEVYSAQMNKQSNVIVSSSKDILIKVWKISDQNKWECTQTILKHNDQVNCTIINNDSSMIISCSDDKTIKIHKRNQIQ